MTASMGYWNSGSNSMSAVSSGSDVTASSARSLTTRPTGIGVEARHDVELDIGPMRPERVHRRHQPIETGVALDGDAKRPGAAARHVGQVALGSLHGAVHLLGQLRQSNAGRREPHGLSAPLEQRQAVGAFQQLELMGEGRLREVQTLRGRAQRMRFGQHGQGSKMAKFEWCCHGVRTFGMNLIQREM